MTAQILKMHKNFTINQMVDEIHKVFATALEAGKKTDRARIHAGQLLIALRNRIEGGEVGENVNWWKWYDQHFARSKRDARRVMKLATAADPDLAADNERVAARDSMAKSRKGTNVCPLDLVTHALRLVEEMDAKQRQQFFAEIRRLYADTYKDD